MDIDVSINVVLSRDNYNLWMQSMKSFLSGRKLWRIVIGDIATPVQPVHIEENTDPDLKTIETYIE